MCQGVKEQFVHSKKMRWRVRGCVKGRIRGCVKGRIRECYGGHKRVSETVLEGMWESILG